MAPPSDATLTATLLEEVDPIIRGAIRKKLRVSLRANDSREENLDGLDLLGEVQLKLLSRLRKESGQTEIREFTAYAATVAYHACADYLRAKYPQRTSVKNCLRRLLEKTPECAVWTAPDGELMCGFAGWRATTPRASGEKIRELQQRPEVLPPEALPHAAAPELSGKDWLRLLSAIFDFASGPVAMDDLLSVVAPLTGAEDLPQPQDWQADSDQASALEKTPAQSADPYSVRLTTEKLRLYWGAILQLLPWHRAAYLLNLRDGDLEALAYYGVVTIVGIGDALELKEKQMATLEREVGVGPGSGSGKRLGERFAVCWRFLPLEDTIVALVLEVTRPQVIGYRNKARERLARSLKALQ